jgi:hypothetical protein
MIVEFLEMPFALAAASIAAVFYLVPDFFPFFPPGKWAVTCNTDFLRKI